MKWADYVYVKKKKKKKNLIFDLIFLPTITLTINYFVTLFVHFPEHVDIQMFQKVL